MVSRRACAGCYQITQLGGHYKGSTVRIVLCRNVPKLFINADPGALLTGRPKELCRSWRHQTEVTIAGKHFVQEDSPDEIGEAIRQFVQGTRRRDS